MDELEYEKENLRKLFLSPETVDLAIEINKQLRLFPCIFHITTTGYKGKRKNKLLFFSIAMREIEDLYDSHFLYDSMLAEWKVLRKWRYRMWTLNSFHKHKKPVNLISEDQKQKMFLQIVRETLKELNR